jgi:hypothetical protein
MVDVVVVVVVGSVNLGGVDGATVDETVGEAVDAVADPGAAPRSSVVVDGSESAAPDPHDATIMIAPATSQTDRRIAKRERDPTTTAKASATTGRPLRPERNPPTRTSHITLRPTTSNKRSGTARQADATVRRSAR